CRCAGLLPPKALSIPSSRRRAGLLPPKKADRALRWKNRAKRTERAGQDEKTQKDEASRPGLVFLCFARKASGEKSAGLIYMGSNPNYLDVGNQKLILSTEKKSDNLSIISLEALSLS
uniref:hypothetical protein n=1 Tax=Paenibacillus pasadenensis TaxID=217090 RepID=UPI001C3F5A9D